MNIGLFAEQDPGTQGMAVSSVVGNTSAGRGLEVAVANLQDYCNGMMPDLVLIINTGRTVQNLCCCWGVLRKYYRKLSQIKKCVENENVF